MRPQVGFGDGGDQMVAVVVCTQLGLTGHVTPEVLARRANEPKGLLREEEDVVQAQDWFRQGNGEGQTG